MTRYEVLDPRLGTPEHLDHHADPEDYILVVLTIVVLAAVLFVLEGLA